LLLEVKSEELRLEILEAENEQKQLNDLMDIEVSALKIKTKELQLKTLESYQRMVTAAAESNKHYSSEILQTSCDIAVSVVNAGVSMIAGFSLQQLVSSTVESVSTCFGNLFMEGGLDSAKFE